MRQWEVLVPEEQLEILVGMQRHPLPGVFCVAGVRLEVEGIWQRAEPN